MNLANVRSGVRWILIRRFWQGLGGAIGGITLGFMEPLISYAAWVDPSVEPSDNQPADSTLDRQCEQGCPEWIDTNLDRYTDLDTVQTHWLKPATYIQPDSLNGPSIFDRAGVDSRGTVLYPEDQAVEVSFANDLTHWPSQLPSLYAQAPNHHLADGASESTPAADENGTASEEPEEDGEPQIDSELGELRIRSRTTDPELGILRIREEPLATPARSPQRPVAYLTGRVGYINSDNIFLAIDDQLGIIGDDFLRSGVALSFYPALGPETFLLAIAETNFQRYTNITNANYDELRFRVGIRQGLTPRTFGEIGWNYQQLFRPSFRDRFFENHAFDLTLRRQDPLTADLTLSSYYRLQLNLSNPAAFDRVIQALGTYAGYSIAPQLEAGLNYQLTLGDYTQQDRYDTYHQVLAQLVYSIQPTTRLSLFGGISFGRSSEPIIRFDDVIFGIFLESSLVSF